MRITRPGHRTQRRAAVAVLTAVSLVMIFAFAAIAIDLGQMYAARAELQRAADAAALAGASAYFTDEGLARDPSEVEYAVHERAKEFSYRNETRKAGTLLEDADITLGYHDFQHPRAPLDTSGDQPFNAVEVIVRRTPGSANGPIAFLFARAFGRHEGGVTARAVASVNDQFSGFDTESRDFPTLIPITINVALYDDMLLSSGTDEYMYDGSVGRGSDGVNEVKLYPWRIKTTKNRGYRLSSGDTVYEPEGAGNFGLLDFGGVDAATASTNILNGISGDLITNVFGDTTIEYFNDSGDPVTYPIPGATGMTTSIKAALDQRIGDVVGFFVHDDAVKMGSNAVYRNVGLRFARIMKVDITSGPNGEGLVVQPVPYAGGSVVVNDGAPSTHRQLGRVLLTE